MLAVPWIFEAQLAHTVRSRHHFRGMLLFTECLLIVEMLAFAMVVSPSSGIFRTMGAGSGNGIAIFSVLFLISLTTAWHEVLAEAFYFYRLRSHLKQFYDMPRLFVSQSMVVVTYGLLIIMVGTLEVLYRSIFVSWAIVFRVMAGVMALYLLWHVFVLPRVVEPLHPVVRERTLDLFSRRFSARSHSGGMKLYLLTFFLLLPQALMFYTRVLFLLAPVERGGLSCSIQELGFAHGVVGAIAFGAGLLFSRRMKVKALSRKNRQNMSFLLFNTVLLSPLVYLYMSYCPPSSLLMLCLCTFVAQFLFGFGLHRTLAQFGMAAYNGLRLPIVALSMMFPIAVSAYLADVWGFRLFFLIDSLTAVFPFLFLKFVKQ